MRDRSNRPRHDGRSWGAGTLGWSGTIIFSMQNGETGETDTRVLPLAQCVLVAGTAPIYDMLYLLQNFGAVARRPRGKARITLIAKTDANLWPSRIPGGTLEAGQRLAGLDVSP